MNLKNMNSRDLFKNNSENIIDYLNNQKIIIYGMGKIGKLLFEAFKYYDVKIEFLWDNNAEIVQKNFDSKIEPPDIDFILNKDEYLIFITIFSDNLSGQIANELSENGFINIIFEKYFIYNFIYSVCYNKKKIGEFLYDVKKCHNCPISSEMENRCDIYDSYIINKAGIKLNGDLLNRVIIPSMGVLITNRCNLTCKGCNHLRDLYKPTDLLEITTSAILNDLTNITNSVDFIDKIVIVGGEAFIHKDVYNIINNILKFKKIGLIHIITNGTIVLKDERLYKLLSDNRVIIEISGYGNLIPKQLQGNVRKFIKKLEEHNINYLQMETLQWFDFGEFKYRNYSTAIHHKIYKTCCFVSNDLFDGKLFKCSRSAFGTHIHKIPDYKNDYIDVRNLSKDQLRIEIDKFLKNEYPMVCQYCNGTSTSTIKAGVQSKGK